MGKSAKRPKRNLAVYADTHQRVSELATGLGVSVADLFERELGVARAVVFDSLFAREKLGSTGLGQSVAIPHGRIKGLRDAIAAVVRVAEPIPFDSPDGQPVRLLVFLLVPEHATEEHLEILSELAELLSDTGIRETLMTSDDAASIHRVLATWEPYRPAA